MNNNFIKQKEHDPFCWKYTTHIILSWFAIFYSYHDLPSSMFCHTKDSMLSSKFPYNAKYFYKMKQSFLYFTLLCLTIQLTTVRGLHTMVDNNTMSYKQYDALEAVFDVQNIHALKYDKYEVWLHYVIQTTWRTRGCDASTIHLNSVKLNPSQWTMCAQAKGPWFEPRFGNLLKTFDIISIYFIYFLSFI